MSRGQTFSDHCSGGNEPAGFLTTVDHRVFLIDGELMFATDPSDVRETSWWACPDGSPWPAGQRLTQEICTTLGSFRDDELEAFLAEPENVKIQHRWPVRPVLYKARDLGRAFACSGIWPEAVMGPASKPPAM